MTHADINDLETRDYIFKIGDRGKGIQARYDENTDTLIFPRAAFDYVCELLKEALSQEPTDAISRKDIQDYIAKYLSQYLYENVRQAVEVIDAYIGDMPSVTQKSDKYRKEAKRWKNKWLKSQKSGKWIDINGIYAECSNCNEEIYITGDFKYCPNCGAKMESGDKE